MAAEATVLVSIGMAMASGFLKPVMKKCEDALSKTDSAAGLKSAILGNLKPKLVELERELGKLNDLLSGAEELNPVQRTRNGLLSRWLKRVKEAAIFADNLLEEISYYHLRKQAESNSISMVSNLFSASDGTSIRFRNKIGGKLNKFKTMATQIYKEAAEIGVKPVKLEANPGSYQPPSDMCTDQLLSIRENVDTSIVVGRQSDEDLIVGELCGTNNEEVLGVIALVGMSGVGKTTLARKIYDANMVATKYKHKSWISMSRDFNLKRLLDEMLQSVTGVCHNLTNTYAMEKKLQECLQRESHLLVLDDVWNTDKLVWDSIRSLLVRVTAGCTASKVLVTTQSSDVASLMGDFLIHRVKVLSNDDAWALFESKAFANRSPQQKSDLRDIGERILNKCGGLPLAINTLASLLASMDEISEWERIDRDQFWKLPRETKIMPWLLLSFNHLPNPVVKKCFALCSVLIPKGYCQTEESLIKSWIAQGYIQPSKTDDNSNMVNIGRMCIKSMLANNLLQSKERKELIEFTMHDLIHGLALYVSMDSSLVIRDSNDLSEASIGVEHVFIHGKTCKSPLNFPEGNTQSTLRTLFWFNGTIPMDLVVQARFLRELGLLDCGLKEIPSSIGGLKHLRILYLNGNPFEYLPENIGRLYNLRVLSLLNCDSLVELPQQVTKLINLREIRTTKAVHIPKGMGQLTRLTQLPVVKLKAGDGCKITELGSLQNLGGRVEIEQLENLCSKEEAAGAGLKNKQGIIDLILVWTYGHGENKVCCNDEEVMEGLQPHSNLKDLSVYNFYGKRFSPWMSDGLYYNSLTRLALVNCVKCEQFPTLGCLPCLEYLSIGGMESVEVIGIDFFACSSTRSSLDDTCQSKLFPRLKEFDLWRMPKLKEWVDPSGSCASAFPCLKELSIKMCPSLVRVPTCFQSLKQLTVEEMDSGEPLGMILSNSDKLTSLKVRSVEHLTCLTEPLLNCTSLQLLEISGCKKLVELPSSLQSLGCLETLEVFWCDSLTSLPDIEGLKSLTKLKIIWCSNITTAPSGLESCVSLEELHLMGCANMSLIPDLSSLSRLQILSLQTDYSEQISTMRFTNQPSGLSNIVVGGHTKKVENPSGIFQLPKSGLVAGAEIKIPKECVEVSKILSPDHPTLDGEKLIKYGLEEMISLPEWLGNLSSLQVLDISRCKKLKNLPSLDAMRRLTRLSTLSIHQCPELEGRCRKGGDEWHKICHIPNIWINQVVAD